MGGQLVDQFGYAVSSGGGGRLLTASRPESTRRPSWPTRVESFSRGVGYQDRRVILSAHRQLIRNFDPLSAAIETKAIHSVGRAWGPFFEGEDQAWGAEATAWLNDGFFDICETLGEQYDWTTGIYLESTTADTDGGGMVLLTQSANGFPQFQHITYDRLGQRNSGQNAVGKEDAWTFAEDSEGENARKFRGAYAGCRIEQGVILNSTGTPIALRILGERPDLDQDVPLRDCAHYFDPLVFGQLVGLPALAGVLEFLAMMHETHDAESIALLGASKIALLESNESGAADDDGMGLGSAPAADGGPVKEEWFSGQMRYIKSTGKLEAFQSARPSDQWDRYQDRIMRIGLARLWPYSLIWKPDAMNGTQERSAIELARALVRDRQDMLRPVQRKKVRYAVCRAIKQGILPPYGGRDIGGQLKWGFHMPPRFSIDPGRDAQQAREDYKLGFSNLGGYLAAVGGGSVREHWRARANEICDMEDAIKEVEAERGHKIDPRRMQMLNPNEQATAPQNDPAPPPAPQNTP